MKFVTNDGKEFNNIDDAREWESQIQKDTELEQAVQEMANLQRAIGAAIKAAEDHADKYGLSFGISPTYGMGGTYEGRGTGEWESSDAWERSDYGWTSSSELC